MVKSQGLEDEARFIYLPLCFLTRKSVRKSESV